MISSKQLMAGGKDTLLKLWCHEESRVFRDRLISEEDRDWFNGALAKELSRKGLDTTWEVGEFADVLFGDYGTGTPIPDPGPLNGPAIR